METMTQVSGIGSVRLSLCQCGKRKHFDWISETLTVSHSADKFEHKNTPCERRWNTDIKKIVSHLKFFDNETVMFIWNNNVPHSTNSFIPEQECVVPLVYPDPESTNIEDLILIVKETHFFEGTNPGFFRSKLCLIRCSKRRFAIYCKWRWGFRHARRKNIILFSYRNIENWSNDPNLLASSIRWMSECVA